MWYWLEAGDRHWKPQNRRKNNPKLQKKNNNKNKNKIGQNRKPLAKSLKPINFHILVNKTLIDPKHWWQMEHTEVSQLFEISWGAKLLLRSKRNRNPFAYRIRSPDSVFDEKRKPNAEKRKIRKPRKTPQPKNRIFFFCSQNRKPQKPKASSLRLSQLWLFEEYSLSPWGLVFLSINYRGLFLCYFQFLCGSNTLSLSSYFYKRSPLQSSRRFYTWYIPERVLVFPCKMEMILFLCFYSTLWRNLIEKISEPQFKRCLIFFSSNIYIFIAPSK